MTAGLRAGQVAAAAGVGRETLRYYERRGLLEPTERTLGGHRLYPAAAVTRLRTIKAAQRLGFTLEEIAELTDPRAHRRRGDGGLQSGARAKLDQVETRIADLQAVAGLLRDAVSAGCDDLDVCAATPACPLPFLEATHPAEPRGA
ncbi:MerR family transcriptional regulator [Glycomyces albidus]|uniref:MerR family transcriptional regulator n=1 Tax=Glycomyces albidus TaxID=2656774 RepID=A0A6L5GB43_9ACTN|nr:MerR family transcriptional regulator [Glycomyces albidus]MQM26885.1 MerR family transcriptional regulator [Glycomyces albidus]